jgi:hypothetical protein
LFFPKQPKALLPAFLFLAFGMLAVGLSFAVLGRETHGWPMLLSDAKATVPQPSIVRAQTRRTRSVARHGASEPLPQASAELQDQVAGGPA